MSIRWSAALKRVLSPISTDPPTGRPIPLAPPNLFHPDQRSAESGTGCLTSPSMALGFESAVRLSRSTTPTTVRVNDSARAGDELRELLVKTGVSVKNVSKALPTSVDPNDLLIILHPILAAGITASLVIVVTQSNHLPVQTESHVNVETCRPEAISPVALLSDRRRVRCI
ncbi:hypothetical protein EVAR_14973_1 [Eumeta japonica]|uniref:Uncharacterized protein n=1 Tax=Eumeta variegata TaxID=151549 RepID=A0A4C1XRE3_EUMVA|nr:hypothetical protein EVAR_14973_1 [Eumeta japonica]